MRQAVDVVCHVAHWGPDGLDADEMLDRASIVRAAAEAAEPMAPDAARALCYAAAVALDLAHTRGV